MRDRAYCGHSPRFIYLDILNILACFCVLALHCNGIAHVYSDTLAWRQALAVEVVAYWAVPVFFMISGATLMNYRSKYDTKTFLKKRMMRVGTPFVAWTIVNLVFKQAIGLIDIASMGIQETVNQCINTSVENVYWFFIPLFSVYLCVPLLSKLVESKKTLWYAFFVSFVLQSVAPYIFQWLGIQYNWSLSIPVASGYVMYFILGYLLSVKDFSCTQRACIYALGVASTVFRYIATTVLSDHAGSIDKTYFSYTGFFAVFLAAAVFLLIKNISWETIFSGNKTEKIVSSIASCSFGIYLIHMIIYRVGSVVLGWNLEVWQGRIFGPFILYVICLAAIFVLKRIPGIKHIVP